MTVSVHLILSPKRLKQFPGLSEEAMRLALQRAKGRIRAVAMDQTPVRTGVLRDSFDIGASVRSLVFKWSAPYAKIVDEGRGPISFPVHFKSSGGFGPEWVRTSKGVAGFPAKNFSAAVKQRALEIIMEELASSFQAIGG